MEGKVDNAVDFYELVWDTEFFGVTSAKAVLNKELDLKEWEELKNKFNKYEFVSIVNKNSEPVNTQLIGKDTSALLADVNIQFTKQIEAYHETSKNIEIHNYLMRNDQILEIADFPFSKFTEDPQFARRRGDKIYQQWLVNSFNRSDKFFALSMEQNGTINGFLLHSYSDNTCVIELIAVSHKVSNRGLGASLFKVVENSAISKGINQIKVGTQARNISAINFYHKVGCKQVGCHQVYHLWNLLDS